jgi:hypothetical protein
MKTLDHSPSRQRGHVHQRLLAPAEHLYEVLHRCLAPRRQRMMPPERWATKYLMRHEKWPHVPLPLDVALAFNYTQA